MKTIRNLALSIFTALTYLLQVIFALSEVLSLVALIPHFGANFHKFLIFFHSVTLNGINYWILNDIKNILAFITAMALFIIMGGVRKIIRNIRKQHYFVLDNLGHLKSILTWGITIIAIGFINILALYPTKGFSNLSSYANRALDTQILWGRMESWLIEIVFLVIIYAIYRVFNSGLNLKKENNQFI